MPIRPIFFVLFIVVCFMCVSSYGDTISLEDRARLGGVYSLEKLKRYSEAIPIITQLYQRYPDDLEIRWTYARVLGFGGHWKEAVRVFDALCAKGCNTNELMTYAHVLQAQGSDPEVLAYMKKLADSHKDQKEIQSLYTNMLVWNRQSPVSPSSAGGRMKISPSTITATLIAEKKLDLALAQLETILQTSPDDENALLWKARILSWRGKKNISISIYKKLIQKYPDKILYYRETARVMGWAGKTGPSASLYDQACQRFPQDQALHAEARAKKAYYNNLFFQAQRFYHQWLALEPDNPEALFDLGQIYAQSHRYRAAGNDYAELVNKYPYNAQAQSVLDKARLYDRGWQVEGGFLRDEQQGKTRQVDARLYDAYEQLKKSILGNITLGIRVDEMNYSFPGPFYVNRERYSAFLEQYFFPDMFWKAGYGLSNTLNKDRRLQYPNGEVQFPLLTERLLLNFSYNRDDFIQNYAMLTERLQEDRYRARVIWRPIKPFEIGVDEAHSHFTDGNSLENFGGDIAWHLLYDPTRLTIKYRWQEWRFRQNKPDYFSPRKFPSQRVSVEWEQFLNKDNLYWGANNFSYFLHYEFIDDHGNQFGDSGGIGFNWYVNKSVTLRLEAQHIYYNHPGIYSNDEQTLSCIFVF